MAAKSTGSLLFASGLAGSLNGCLVVDKDRDTHLLSSLLLPPPALALTVSSNRRHEYVLYLVVVLRKCRLAGCIHV